MTERTHTAHGQVYHLSSYGGTHRLYGPGITTAVFFHCHKNHQTGAYTWTIPGGQGEHFNDWRTAINAYVARRLVEAQV